MEKIEVGRTGFDLICCAGFYTNSETINTLRQHMGDEYFPHSETRDLVCTGAVYIKETEFEYRYFWSNLKKTFFTTLKIHAARPDGNNIMNMNVADVWNKIKIAEQKLYSKYGLCVNEDRVEIHSAEINRTFVPIDEVHAYKRVFQLMAVVVLRHSGKKYDVSTEKLTNAFNQQGMLLKRKSYSYRVYDKAAQMKAEMAGISFDSPLLRVEITYHDKQTVLTDFKTLDLVDITDEMVETVFCKRMGNIRKDIMEYLNQKQQYRPGFVGRNNTIPNMIANYRAWGEVLSAISSYEANYGVPCMLDSRDMQTALNNLHAWERIDDGLIQEYYAEYLKIYKSIPEAVTLLDEQRELFKDFFSKVMGEGSLSVVKMRN